MASQELGHRISIPAPARGRTVIREIPLGIEQISIPAPARGRTSSAGSHAGLLRFQFPPPRGGELLIFSPEESFEKYFNSRPREGANLRYAARKSCALNFNSRPREGANKGRHPVGHRNDISIPAPARGRTTHGKATDLSSLFQFPPPRGGERATTVSRAY